MTDTKDQDATQLQRRARRRLVGAIALAVLAVIVLPIVFDKEPKPISQDLVIQIPNQDTAPKFDPKLTPPPPAPPAVDAKAAPVGAPSAKAPESRTEASPAKSAAAPAAKEPGRDLPKDTPKDVSPDPAKEAPKAPVKDASKDSAKAPAKDASKDPAKDPAKEPARDAKKESAREVAKDGAKANAAKGGDAKRAQALLEGSGTWIVPMGSYTSADRVKNLQAKAKAAGFNSYTEQIKGPKGEDLIRLRAGPFPAREDADRAHDALKAAGLVAGTVAQR